MRLRTHIWGLTVVLFVSAGAYVIWLVFFYTTFVGGGATRTGFARVDVKTLGTAAMAFELRYGQLPATLDVLTKRQSDGSGAFLAGEKSLIDPWGRPFHYDPGQRHPRSRCPLIWSDGPDPANPNGKITNWD